MSTEPVGPDPGTAPAWWPWAQSQPSAAPGPAPRDVARLSSLPPPPAGPLAATDIPSAEPACIPDEDDLDNLDNPGSADQGEDEQAGRPYQHFTDGRLAPPAAGIKTLRPVAVMPSTQGLQGQPPELDQDDGDRDTDGLGGWSLDGTQGLDNEEPDNEEPDNEEPDNEEPDDEEPDDEEPDDEEPDDEEPDDNGRMDYFRRWSAAQEVLRQNSATSLELQGAADNGSGLPSADDSWDDDEDEDFDPDEFDWSPIGRDLASLVPAPAAKPGLAYEPLDEQAWELVNSPQLTQYDLDQLIAHKDQLIRCTLVTRPDCPAQVLQQLSDDPSQIVRWALLRHPACPPEILEAAANSDDSVKLMLAVAHSNLPASALAALAVPTASPEVLCALMSRPDTSRDVCHLAMEHLDKPHRMQMARQTNLPASTYNTLASDPEIRQLVLTNPDCPRSLLAMSQLVQPVASDDT